MATGRLEIPPQESETPILLPPTPPILSHASMETKEIPAKDASSSDSATFEPKKDQQQVTALHDLIAGGIAGSASVVVGHPFDTIKVRLQTSRPGSSTSPFAFGGVRSLFRGMAAPLSTAALVNAIIFSSFGASNRLWEDTFHEPHHETHGVISAEGGVVIGHTPSESPSQHQELTKSFVCGSFAGFVQCFVICPMEHIKCRLQIQHGKGARDNVFKGPVDAGRRILQDHGLRGLYRGMFSTLWREVPAFGVYFATYDTVKDYITSLVDDGSHDTVHTYVASALAGGFSGSLTWAMIYPIDVIKSRIQTAPLTASPSSLGIVSVGQSILREHGWRYMFRGLGVTLARAFPVNGIIFPVYEFTLMQLGHQSSI